MNALQNTWNRLFAQMPALRENDPQRGQAQSGRFRPQLHVSPPTGWLNDPNGLCQIGDVYHVFYQFSPFDPEGGLKFWGHCTSRDLLHWDFAGVPLLPDQPGDCHGVYSGSALTEDGNLYLYYTGNVKRTGSYDYIRTGRETNTMLAISRDGRGIESKECLMTNKDYPAGLTLHVRDPKVWKQDGVYYMIQGARTLDDRGVALLFSSPDRRSWRYIHTLRTANPFGYMWECPDLYELDGKTVLSVSPQGVPADGFRYQNKYQSVICFLEPDFLHASVPDGFQELDAGFDFYAPQTFLARDGHRIQIAWMGVPDEETHTNATLADGWQHILTLPRELSVQNGVLCQNPVRELSAWWNQETSFKVGFCRQTEACFELELFNGGEDFEAAFAGGLVCTYRKSDGLFSLRFTDPQLGGGRTLRARKVGRLSRIRVFFDVSSAEIFLNDGEAVFSTRLYPQAEAYHIQAHGRQLHGFYRFHKANAPTNQCTP